MSQRRIYQDEYPYFVTTKTKEGVWFFDETKYAKLLSDIIFKACELKKFILYAYCIMPDHLHLLVKQIIHTLQAQVSEPSIGISNEPTAGAETRAGFGVKKFSKTTPAHLSVGAVGDGQYNISQLMYTIKSYFINELGKRYKIDYSIWQKRFNTRIVDTEERLRNTIEYIKNNPEKLGLPKKYQKFPYMYFNWKEIFELF